MLYFKSFVFALATTVVFVLVSVVVTVTIIIVNLPKSPEGGGVGWDPISFWKVVPPTFIPIVGVLFTGAFMWWYRKLSQGPPK
jgi:hypothetical protein